jgi:uncharacterized protein (TIGR02271 family)
MDVKHALRSGMRVVGPDEQDYGAIERYDDAAVYVRGRRIPRSAIEHMDRDRLYVSTPELWHLPDSGSALTDPGDGDLGGEARVPLLEERLDFGTREIDLGEIRVHKTVEESEEVKRGPLNREDVQVERVRVDRRVRAPEEQRMEGEWLVIPIMEEVYVVEKHLMVAEEIRIRKRLVTEEGEVRETVRRERATVEDTRVPRNTLLPEAVVPRGDANRARSAENEDHAVASDDAAWEALHREVRDAGQ